MLLWGFFIKLCIADRLGLYVDVVYNNILQHDGITLFLASVFYTIQIYCDFAGYSLMAIGAGKLLGIDLQTNFIRPYFAQTVTDFWRRWHISLTTWFRDYIYFPLGGNRVKKWRWMFNVMVVFIVSGIWHGGLTADTDVTLADIAKLTDVFYIGGTKCGALCGEAVVFTHGNMPRQFVTMVKRRGAMIAKGRLNALQFDALFTDGLYEKICAPAVKLAIKLRDGLKAKGYRFAMESPTNQQFIIVENSRLPELQSKVVYSFIEKYDAEHTVIRLATSWATTEEQVDELLSIL